jgi:hypothetical protein
MWSQSSDRLLMASIAETSDTDERAVSPTRRGFPTSAVAFGAVEVAAFVALMYLGRDLWFWADEWDFIAARKAGNLRDLVRPHVEHLTTLPILTYRLLYWLYGIRVYWPYLLLIVMLHLIGALLLRTAMLRVGVRPWTASAVASVFVVFGSGSRDILWPFQITFVGSLVFGLAHLILADHDGAFDRRDWLGLAAGTAAILCSGVGAVMVLAVGVAVFLRRGVRVALAHCVPLIGFYLTWFLTLGYGDYRRTRSQHGSATIPRAVQFGGEMITSTFRALGQVPVVGAALGVALIVGLVLAWRPLDADEFRIRAALPIGLFVATVAFVIGTGLQRATWMQPSESRYLYVVAYMVIPALGVAVDALLLRSRALTPVLLALLVVGIPGNVQSFARYVDQQREPQQLFRTMIATLPRLPIARQVPASQSPQAGADPCIPSLAWLRDAATGRLPDVSKPTEVEAATDTIRMSLVLFNCLGQLNPRPHVVPETCVQLRQPIIVRLRRGEAIKIRAGIVRFVPPAGPIDPVFPIIAPAGRSAVAIRSVSVRVMTDSPSTLAAVQDRGGRIRTPHTTADSLAGLATACVPSGAARTASERPRPRPSAASS